MRFDYDKTSGNSETSSDGIPESLDAAAASEAGADAAPTAGDTAQPAAPGPGNSTSPAPTSPWQPAPAVGWTRTGQSQWAAPSSAPSGWPAQQPPAQQPPAQQPPAQQPPAPPVWGAGQNWQPQSNWQPRSNWQPSQPPTAYANWNMPPAGDVTSRRPDRLPQVLVIIAACLIAFSGGLVTDHVAFPGTTTVTTTQAPGSKATPNASIQSSALYNQALQIVKQNFVGASSITDKQLLYGSISGMVDSLGDTGHSVFLTAQEYAAMQSSLGANFAGIGVVLSDDNGAFKVNRVLTGTPAAAAGVKPGDLITAVDGASTSSMTFDQLSASIRGTAGTKVTISVIHVGSTDPVDITMTRANIDVPLAEWGMVPGTHIADISLAEFSTGAADQVQADITAARAAGATSLILDLRGNPGGYADQAQEVASEFLTKGVVYIQQDAKGNNTDESVDTARTHTNLPLVVLVDHDSASSSEIVAGALQDSTRARIVGVSTFGTGTVLQPFPLSDGSVIILGIAWWLTPNGHRIFGVGITPDQTVQMPSTALPTDPTTLGTMTTAQLDASGDAQLLAAVADLPK
jgi:carboxyl-terminal processing protease